MLTSDTRLATPTGLSPAVRSAWLAELNSDRTRRLYSMIVDAFIQHVDDPRTATAAHVHAFAYAPGPRSPEPAPSTVTVRLAALRSFFDFLRRMGLIDSNPVNDVKRPKSRHPEVRGLDANVLQRLISSLPNSSTGQRDRALILTFVLTGLRLSELLGLRRRDLTRNWAVYYTVTTKGGRIRRRELPAPCFNEIVSYLESTGRPLQTLADEERIFPVAAISFYQNLVRYAEKAGLGHVTPHDLRHSAAKLRRDTGASIEEVSSFLGHANISTTARYLARLQGEDDDGWEQVAAALGVA